MYHIFVFFSSVFDLSLIFYSWLVHGKCCLFLWGFLLSLSLFPLIRCYYCVETVVFLL